MTRLLVLLLATVVACGAQARLTEIRVQAIEPFSDGASVGEWGAYERVRGVARGERDPADRRNRGIVNLERAPRNAAGRVDYELDWFMLRPARGNGRLVYEVTNRGRKLLAPYLMDATSGSANDPKGLADVGNAFFLNRGYTLVWSGWDADAPKANNGMSMKSPVVPGVVRVIREELVSGTRAPQVETFRLSYEAASLDPSQSTLTVRRLERDPRVPVEWSWLNTREIRLANGKPEPGALYEFHYPAKDPKVQGIGFAAARDLVSFLRYESSDDEFQRNPAGGGITHALALGVSQSGRYLRDFVQQGFNEDESARKVFDGVLSHIAGIGGVFLNAEFAQPGRTNTQHEDHLFPENSHPFSAVR